MINNTLLDFIEEHDAASMATYTDHPSATLFLICCWVAALVQLSGQGSEGHLQVVAAAARRLGIARIVFLLARLCVGPYLGVPILEAAVTTAPYASAFYMHSLLIASLGAARRTLHVPRSSRQLSSWRHFLLNAANAVMTGGFFNLFLYVLMTRDAGRRKGLALLGSAFHLLIFTGLAGGLSFAISHRSTRGIYVQCHGGAVALRKVIGVFCFSLCGTAGQKSRLPRVGTAPPHLPSSGSGCRSYAPRSAACAAWQLAFAPGARLSPAPPQSRAFCWGASPRQVRAGLPHDAKLGRPEKVRRALHRHAGQLPRR